jgi:hypothetical protein
MSTPDQLPLSRPPRPLDCVDEKPRGPVSWCSAVAQGKDNGRKASGHTSLMSSFSDSALYLSRFA